MNTIGQISEMFDIPISTLRYYDKEGLFPDMQRTSGIRNFSDTEVEALRVIECLKKSGMEIKDIKTFIEWCTMGSETYHQRKELFINQEKIVKAQIERLEKTLAMIKYKHWYYEQAIKDGNEDRLIAMIPNNLPEDIQALYETSHSSQTEK
jgi:DNA-binding transcriptional MerR regulator